jgi:hypothetical protein
MSDPRATPERAANLEACTCPDETPNEVACILRHPDGTLTCGVCGGVIEEVDGDV